MNPAADQFYHALWSVVAIWCTLVWALGRVHTVTSRPVWLLTASMPAAALLFIPVGSASLWQWMLGAIPNPSLISMGALSVFLWQRITGSVLCGRSDRILFVVFGLVSGTVLYLHPYFEFAGDLYFWGWDHRLSVWTIALAAAVCLLFGNRLGVIIALALAGYEYGILESHNAWDYVVDPIYWLGSVIVAARVASSWVLRRMRRPSRRVRTPSPSIIITVTRDSEARNRQLSAASVSETESP